MRLGRQELKQLGSVDRPTTFYDDDLKGFGLRVMPPSTKSPTGTRTWIVEYRPGSGGRNVAKRRLALGRAETVTPEQARKAAKDILANARVGEDPAAGRAEARKAKTIGELKERYLAESNRLRKASTAAYYRALWDRYIEPELGTKSVRNLKRSDVEWLHQGIGAKHPTTANRVVILISHFYEWAKRRGEAPEGANPARGLDKYREGKRERYLTPLEFGRLGAAIREAETVGIEWTIDTNNPKSKHAPKRPENRRSTISPHAAAALRLLLFTGARLREILHLRWEHVDLSRGMLFLPDSKTGRKTIVLSAAAVAIFQELAKKELRVSEYVIAGDDPKKPRSDLKRPWALVSTRAKLEGVRLHDLRHSFASIGAGAGMGLPLIGKLLGHADSATTARYAHLDADPLKRATDAIGAMISEAMGQGGMS